MAVTLYYPTAIQQVQDALLDVIALAFMKRDPVVADLAALAALPTVGASNSNATQDRSIRLVATEGDCWIWRFMSTAAAGANVVVPTDRVASGKPGRWHRTSSPIQNVDGQVISAQSSGYLKNVALWAGERTGADWDLRILHRRPAVILAFVGEDMGEFDSSPRGLMSSGVIRLETWACSFNARAQLEAERGSDVAAEAAADPGVARISGDLKNLLHGLQGVQLDIYAGRDSDTAAGGIGGIDHMLVGNVNPFIEDLAGREYVWTRSLDVQVTTMKRGPSPVALDTLTGQGTADALDYPVDTIIPSVGADDATP